MIVDRDSDVTGFLWNAYEGAGPWPSGVLDESGGEVRVENGVDLLREERVQSVRARLNRVCSGRDLDFKWSSRARAESSLNEEKMSAYSLSVALRASMALGFQPGASSP